MDVLSEVLKVIKLAGLPPILKVPIRDGAAGQWLESSIRFSVGKSSSRSVADIAADVGYESEPAFNRAFKREFEVPPARYRNNSRAGAVPDSKLAQEPRSYPEEFST